MVQSCSFSRKGTRVLALTVFLLGAAVAPGVSQSVVFEDDKIEILGTVGERDALLGRGNLVLGGPSAQPGFFSLLDGNGFHTFTINSVKKLTTVTEDLFLRRDGGTPDLTTIRLQGDVGNLSVGGDGEDGDLFLYDNAFDQRVHIDGETGNAETHFGGNGFIKGWARVSAGGTVLSCYKCDDDSMKSFKFALGSYYVDFSPIASDISSRPRMAVLDRHGTVVPGVDVIYLEDDATDPSRVKVFTGPAQDHSFTIMVY